MCDAHPCLSSPAAHVRDEPHSGVDAVVRILGHLAWRGVQGTAPSPVQRDVLAALARGHVVPRILDERQCGQWWWLATPQMPDALDPTDPLTWRDMADLLARWHRIAPEPPAGAPSWQAGYALAGAGGREAWCHTDLHDENVRGVRGTLYAIDGWYPQVGPVAADVAVLGAYAVEATNDWGSWTRVLDAYRDASGDDDARRLDPVAAVLLVATYGPAPFTARMIELAGSYPAPMTQA